MHSAHGKDSETYTLSSTPHWDSNDIQFVVRLKSDIQYERIGEFDQPDDKEQNILIDECIKLTGEKTSLNYKKATLRQNRCVNAKSQPSKKKHAKLAKEWYS